MAESFTAADALMMTLICSEPSISAQKHFQWI